MILPRHLLRISCFYFHVLQEILEKESCSLSLTFRGGQVTSGARPEKLATGLAGP